MSKLTITTLLPSNAKIPYVSPLVSGAYPAFVIGRHPIHGGENCSVVSPNILGHTAGAPLQYG
ncbi:hypothetical protein P4377_24940 [Bacillus thuringiensis]|nr:hypothetical protein [Bacillus thuringiensis]